MSLASLPSRKATQPMFSDGRRADGHAERDDAQAAASRRGCPACGRHFSGATRFCPFDGEPLDAVPAADTESDPLLGRLVDGRYRVEAVLGEGGMGTVYRVSHSALGRRFAMKALRADLAGDADLASRFMREAQTAAAVAHPSVVEIIDFGYLSGSRPYFVMELIEGQPLSIAMLAVPFPLEELLSAMSAVARGLDAAHRAGIVHRDLKPDNIVVSRRGGVKIVDFGLARVLGQSRVTRGGMVFGTPHYMSPEQARGLEIDARSDQYAFGVVMYEVFVGRVPFDAETYMGVMTQHVHGALVPPSERAPEGRLTPELERIIVKCLAKDPAERYQDMGDLAGDLDRAREALPRAHVPPGDTGPPGLIPADDRGSLRLGSSHKQANRLAALYAGLALAGGVAAFVTRLAVQDAPEEAATARGAPEVPASALVPVGQAPGTQPRTSISAVPVRTSPELPRAPAAVSAGSSLRTQAAQ